MVLGTLIPDKKEPGRSDTREARREFAARRYRFGAALTAAFAPHLLVPGTCPPVTRSVEEVRARLSAR
jgi:hypothetical protein